MGSLARKPLVELRVELANSAFGPCHRNVVVCEDLVLHNLHRIIQMCWATRLFSYVEDADESLNEMRYTFAFKGAKLGKLRATALNAAALGEEFLSGREPLQYVQGGKQFVITAHKRAHGNAKYYVPRCPSSSADTDVDDINELLLTRRFGRNQTHNKRKKDPPKLLVPDYATDASLWRCYLNAMRWPVDYDEKLELSYADGNS